MKGFRLARGAATLILAAAVPACGQVLARRRRRRSPSMSASSTNRSTTGTAIGTGPTCGCRIRRPELRRSSGSRRSIVTGATEQNVGVGSYITLDAHSYAIVGVSSAPGGSAVFYPKLRWDASVFTDTRAVPGLMVGVGFTQLSFGAGSTGSIVSVGPIYYHGPLILSGSLRLNHDGVGGANTAPARRRPVRRAGQALGRRERRRGARSVRDPGRTPLDVHFTDIGGSAFYQRWLRPIPPRWCGSTTSTSSPPISVAGSRSRIVSSSDAAGRSTAAAPRWSRGTIVVGVASLVSGVLYVLFSQELLRHDLSDAGYKHTLIRQFIHAYGFSKIDLLHPVSGRGVLLVSRSRDAGRDCRFSHSTRPRRRPWPRRVDDVCRRGDHGRGARHRDDPLAGRPRRARLDALAGGHRRDRGGRRRLHLARRHARPTTGRSEAASLPIRCTIRDGDGRSPFSSCSCRW